MGFSGELSAAEHVAWMGKGRAIRRERRADILRSVVVENLAPSLVFWSLVPTLCVVISEIFEFDLCLP